MLCAFARRVRLSKLKRWSLEEIVRRSSLAQLEEKKPVADAGSSLPTCLAAGRACFKRGYPGSIEVLEFRRTNMSVQMRTMLDVADNSGARKLQVILPLGGGLGKKAGLGDVVTAAVKEARPMAR